MSFIKNIFNISIFRILNIIFTAVATVLISNYLGPEDKGRPAPTAQKMGDFENTPGKDKGTSMKKEVKPQTADGSEKSAKSPISGK